MLKVILFGLFGCNDYMMHKSVQEEYHGTPNIIVIPEQIDFGHLRAGHETGLATVTIINSGDAELDISEVVLNNEDGFTLSQSYFIPIQPGKSEDFEISYTPETYESKTASIIITSDDEDESIKTVPITGFGDAPIIQVSPLSENFTDVEVGCVEEIEILVTNLGNLDLEISSFSHLASIPVDTVLKNQNPLPLMVAPNGVAIVTIEYEPRDLIDDNSQVIIFSNDPVSPEYPAYQEGTAVIAETVSEVFIQEGVGKSDIIFVVDNSGSMGSFQQEVANNINSFMSIFVTLGVDYRIGVITTDSPDFLGPIISPTLSNPNAELANQIGIVAGTFGSAIEQGIEMVFNTTQPGGDAGPGSPFMRNDALLVIVFISDEQDWSNLPWTNLTSYLNNLKGDVSKIVAHSVIGDYPSGCTWTDPNNPSFSRPVPYGSGYYDVTKYYNGIAFSICSHNWGLQMQSMAQNSVVSADYELSESGIIEDSIEITVEGTPNSDWHYDESTNSISFHQSNIPEDGDEIIVTYSLYGCLDEEDTGR